MDAKYGNISLLYPLNIVLPADINTTYNTIETMKYEKERNISEPHFVQEKLNKCSKSSTYLGKHRKNLISWWMQ